MVHAIGFIVNFVGIVTLWVNINFGSVVTTKVMY